MSSPKKKGGQDGGKPGPEKGSGAPGLKTSTIEADFLLGAVCFFSGASVMVIEITGIRLLAPVFGNSLYTWTALIGVVLVAFSAGGYLGGWLVDRSPNPKVLGMILFLSALMTLIIPPLNLAAQRFVGGMGLVAGPVFLSIVLFTIPGVLLGSITPFTIRMLSMVGGDKHIGWAAGFIGMLGSLGSFIGTFASGFLLIPNFGVRQIFLFTAILLLLLSVTVFARFKAGPPRPIAMMMLGASIISGSLILVAQPGELEGTIFSKLNYYHHIRVIDRELEPGRTDRYLQLDTTTEGGQVVETGEINIIYQHYWTLSHPLGDDMRRALFLGAGAFAMPQHLAKKWPEAIVDVVEIDPEVIEVGNDFFRLRDYKNVKAHAMDARRFLLTSEDEYDFIFGDAYNGLRYIPAHLTTAEFFETVKERLSDRGVFVMNIISGLSGERADLFEAIYATVDSVFTNVEIFTVNPRDFVTPHNVLILAGERELGSFYKDVPAGADAEFMRVASTRVNPAAYASSRGEVLTDNRNPVEYIVAKQLEKGEKQ